METKLLLILTQIEKFETAGLEILKMKIDYELKLRKEAHDTEQTNIVDNETGSEKSIG